MEIDHFFFKLFLVNDRCQPKKFLGSAFPITPNGGLLTCRHVVNIEIPNEHSIAVFDPEHSQLKSISTPPIFSSDPKIDLAFLSNAFSRQKEEFFPILTPKALVIGGDVYSFGFFTISGDVSDIEQGYFGGKIVNFFHNEPPHDETSLTLPFPVLEGMSGSPVLTYHNGPKVVGIAIGNRSSRILASEIIEYKDEETDFRETIKRIIEYGVAYHCIAINNFLTNIRIQGHVVSDARVEIPGLE